jgi:hypothetical protein
MSYKIYLQEPWAGIIPVGKGPYWDLVFEEYSRLGGTASP